MFFRRYVPPEETSYRRMAKMGFSPATIIDVGAYEGNWTLLARKIFPAARSIMVEPQDSKKAFLDAVVAKLPNTEYHSTLLSEKPETLSFYEMETGSSILPENSNVPRREVRIEASTLDSLASDVDGPIFLKIDTQGAELKVLSGGGETLKRCAAVQLETALLPYNKGAPVFREVIEFMDDRGFVPFDISGWIRPNGVDLVQIDLIFVPVDSPLRPTSFTF